LPADQHATYSKNHHKDLTYRPTHGDRPIRRGQIGATKKNNLSEEPYRKPVFARTETLAYGMQSAIELLIQERIVFISPISIWWGVIFDNTTWHSIKSKNSLHESNFYL